ncbi:MAG: ATP-binding protein [Candidatus Manganitrophus sp. SB1]|nr:ATP-binding protein [Candidatus Manganitrophus morganii]
MNAEEKINILLVDDRSENLLSLEAILDSPDYQIVKAQSGEEALKQLLLHPDFAVILLDVQMPELDGFETAKLIKRRARLKHIPIIFLTAISHDEDHLFKGYSVGAVDYVLKPFNAHILKSKVSVFVALYKKNRELQQEHKARVDAEAARNYLSFLVDANSLLASSLDYRTTLSRVAQLAVPKLADWCVVDILEEDQSIERLATAHIDPAKVKLAYEVERRYPSDPKATRGIPQVLRSGTPEIYAEIRDNVLEESARDPEHLRILRELGLRSVMIVPLIARERIFGAITFVTAESGRHYAEEDLLFAQDLARRAALAIDNARLYSISQQELAERERVERALQQLNERIREQAGTLNGILSASVDNIYVLDHEGRYKFVSDGGAAVLGFSASDMVGKNWRDLGLPAEVMEQFDRRRKQVLSTGRPDKSEVHFMALSGMRFYEYILFPISTEGGRPHDVVVISRDITERRASEEALKRKTLEAEESSRLKSQFVSNVSHELRTPLNAIFGYTQLLLDETYGAIGPEQKEPLKGVARNAKELLSLINHVLDLSKIESGKETVSPEPLRLPDLLEEIVEGMKPLLEKKPLTLRWDGIESLPPIVSDGNKVKQILTNLLSNAIKFTQRGSITVSGKNHPERETVEIAVQDTGIGIRPEALPKLFTAFYQIDADLTREYEGVGLGLKIAKDLSRLLHGEIRVESRYGVGSTFTLSLPTRWKERNG